LEPSIEPNVAEPRTLEAGPGGLGHLTWKRVQLDVGDV
jgi:hypothetical protein